MSAQTNIALQGFFLRSGSISAVGKVLQRKSTIQLRPGTDAFPVDLRPKSGGWPLPRDVQQKMEAALGANFSDVRIHVGPEASSIGAVAFTWGSDIHFAPGQYSPHTPHGQFLLGHELTHVVQQRSGRVANPFGSGVAVVQDHALEAEADRMGRMAATYRPAREQVSAAAAPAAGSRGGGSVIHQKPAVGQRKPAPPVQYTTRPARRDGNGWEIAAAVAGRQEQAGRVRLVPSDNGVRISDLSVAPEHRRHGVATQLVQAAMRTARSQGYSLAQLEAHPSDADMSAVSLVSMYQRMGFRTTGRSHRGNPLMERRT